MFMFKLIGIRGKIGKALIADAIGGFERASKKLQAGITHLQADVRKHQISISDSEGKIRDLNSHIDRSNRIVAKLKDFVA